jgi:transcriptional regulator with XRE-family HTH domain
MDPTAGQRAFGENVKTERKKLGLTQEKFAKHVGTTKQTVGNWETGRFGISDELMSRLTAILGREATDLWPGWGSQSGTVGGKRDERPPVPIRLDAIEADLASLRAQLLQAGVIAPPDGQEVEAVLRHLERVAGSRARPLDESGESSASDRRRQAP